MRILLTCEGVPEYKAAVQIVARRKNMTMAKMVRHALDKVYGDEIKQESSFFVKDDASSHHKVTKNGKKDEAK